jgi:tetratricopeptide (TPR) repeat protein
MRVAIVLGTTPSEDGVADPNGRTLALPAHLPVGQALPLALDVADEGDLSTLVLEVVGHRTLRGSAAGQFDELFRSGLQRADEYIDRLLVDAEAQRAAGDVEGARRAYECAETLLGNETSERRAHGLVALAAIEHERGRAAVASSLLDRALAFAPEHVPALEARAELAHANGEAAMRVALLARLVPHLETSGARVKALRAVTDESLTAAREAIGIASALMPDTIYVLERLRAVNEASGMWEDALTTAVQIAELNADRRMRARALVDAARLCSERVGNTSRAVALYEAAIEDDPRVPGAFEAIEAELVRADDPAALASAYTRQIERLRASNALVDQCQLLAKLAALQCERLDEPRAAIATLETLVGLDPDNLPARLEQSRLLEAMGEPALATRALESAAFLGPTEVTVYRSLGRLLGRSNDQDRRYLCCSALVALGEADPEEQAIFSQFRPDALPTPRSALDEATWTELLPDGHCALLDEIAALVEPIALGTWLARRSHASIMPPKQRVDPSTSTITAVRCCAWAAKLLSLPEPEIYIRPTEALIGARLSLLGALGVELGQPVLKGRSPGEIAFLAAHHLTYARPGWRIISVLGSADEVRSLLLAGLSAARPAVRAVFELGPHEEEIASALAEHLDVARRQTLASAAERVLGRADALDFVGWLRSVEQVACRAGLLASGDVTVAANVLSVAGSAPGGLSAAERARALLPFCVSQRHSALRHCLGLSAD